MAGARFESAVSSSANIPALPQAVQRADSESSSARLEVKDVVTELPTAESTRSFPAYSTASRFTGQPNRSLVAPDLMPAPSAASHLAKSHTSSPIPSAPLSATGSVSVISSHLQELRKKIRQKMAEITKWTLLLEDFPDMADTMNVQIQRTQDEIFGLHDDIRKGEAKLHD